MSISMLRLHARRHRAWLINLVLLHVRLHVLLPCTATTRASVYTQLVRWLTPRSEPMQRATSSFSVHSPDCGKTDMHGLIMASKKDICSMFETYLPNLDASTYEITWRMFSTQLQNSSNKNDICSMFETYLPNLDASTYEITWRMFSTQLQNSSNKNQIKWISDERVMQLTKPFIGVNRLVDLVVGQFIFVCCLVISQRTTFFLRWLALDRGYIKSHSASLDDPFNPSQFQKCCLPSRIISNTQLK
ncbi:hypothetical protein YC2023_041017 [Brassica napus]